MYRYGRYLPSISPAWRATMAKPALLHPKDPPTYSIDVDAIPEFPLSKQRVGRTPRDSFHCCAQTTALPPMPPPFPLPSGISHQPQPLPAYLPLLFRPGTHTLFPSPPAPPAAPFHPSCRSPCIHLLLTSTIPYPILPYILLLPRISRVFPFPASPCINELKHHVSTIYLTCIEPAAAVSKEERKR